MNKSNKYILPTYLIWNHKPPYYQKYNTFNKTINYPCILRFIVLKEHNVLKKVIFHVLCCCLLCSSWKNPRDLWGSSHPILSSPALNYSRFRSQPEQISLSFPQYGKKSFTSAVRAVVLDADVLSVHWRRGECKWCPLIPQE